MANHTLVAVDLAKSVFEVAISHHPGQVARQRRYTRQQLPLALAQLPPSTMVTEAWRPEEQHRNDEDVQREIGPRPVIPRMARPLPTKQLREAHALRSSRRSSGSSGANADKRQFI